MRTDRVCDRLNVRAICFVVLVCGEFMRLDYSSLKIKML